MKELLKVNLEKEKETSIELEVSFFKVKKKVLFNDGEFILKSSEIILLLKEKDGVWGIVDYDKTLKKIVFIKNEECNIIINKKIFFNRNELESIFRIFSESIFFIE